MEFIAKGPIKWYLTIDGRIYLTRICGSRSGWLNSRDLISEGLKADTHNSPVKYGSSLGVGNFKLSPNIYLRCCHAVYHLISYQTRFWNVLKPVTC